MDDYSYRCKKPESGAATPGDGQALVPVSSAPFAHSPILRARTPEHKPRYFLKTVTIDSVAGTPKA